MTYLAAAAAAKSPDAWDQPGTLAFLIVFGLAVVLVFLLRSMSRHLRNVREAAGREAAGREAAQADASAADGIDATSRRDG